MCHNNKHSPGTFDAGKDFLNTPAFSVACRLTWAERSLDWVVENDVNKV